MKYTEEILKRAHENMVVAVLDCRNAFTKARSSLLQSDEDELDRYHSRLNRPVGTWLTEATREIESEREREIDTVGPFGFPVEAEDSVEPKFARGDLVRHRATNQPAIVNGVVHRCKKHLAFCMGLFNGYRDCDLQPTDMIEIDTGFDESPVAVPAYHLEKIDPRDKRFGVPIDQFVEDMVAAVSDAMGFVDSGQREEIRDAIAEAMQTLRD